MIAIDVLLIVIAIYASIVVYRRRSDILRTGAATGVGCTLAGLWTITALYAADLYTITVVLRTDGLAATMKVAEELHRTANWYLCSVSALLVFAGLVLTVLQFSRQLRNMEVRTEALLENENILDSIFENLPVGLLIKDSNHAIERSNPTYLSWYGRDFNEMLGHRSDQIAGFQSEEDALVMNAQEDDVLTSGKLVNRRVKRFFVDGDLHTLSITKFPVYDRDGKITKVGSVSVDLTELFKAEEAARNAYNEAEKANRAKSQFIATMSHEFRTPLNAILGFSEMLRGEFFGPLGTDNYREYANDIHSSGEHLLGLVNDILDVAAIEAGKRALLKEHFNIGDVLDECIRNFQQQAADRDIELIVNMADDIGPLHADRKAVAQIFLNILANAVKFTEQGGRISISVQAEGDMLKARVADSGIGIPGDFLHRATEPFSKGQPNAHVTKSGTGLGLSIVKSLVDAHGGQLSITSATGKGTEVYVTLPFGEPEK